VLPDLILHADWSTEASEKRQVARAQLRDGAYVLDPPGACRRGLLEELLREADSGKAVLAGFDFAIGVPIAWAEVARAASAVEGVELGPSFLECVAHLPDEFFASGDDPERICWRRPFFANSNAGWRRVRALVGEAPGAQHRFVAQRILADERASRDQLLRCADRRHARRGAAASPLFVLSGAQQVGKASLSGWRELLIPAMRRHADRVRVWPFHGPLEQLVRSGTVTLVEKPIQPNAASILGSPGETR
jgi:hypothetical protein